MRQLFAVGQDEIDRLGDRARSGDVAGDQPASGRQSALGVAPAHRGEVDLDRDRISLDSRGEVEPRLNRQAQKPQGLGSEQKIARAPEAQSQTAIGETKRGLRSPGRDKLASQSRKRFSVRLALEESSIRRTGRGAAHKRSSRRSTRLRSTPAGDCGSPSVFHGDNTRPALYLCIARGLQQIQDGAPRNRSEPPRPSLIRLRNSG